jgi:hypothetical protein
MYVPFASKDLFLIHSTFVIAKKKHATAATKRKRVVLVNDADTTDAEGGIYNKGMVFLERDVCQLDSFLSDVVLGKKKSTTLGNPQAIDADGLLMYVDVQLVNDHSSACEDKWQDVDQFFCTVCVKEVNGVSKRYCMCKICL